MLYWCFVSIFPYLALCSISKQYHSQLLLYHETEWLQQQGDKLVITG